MTLKRFRFSTIWVFAPFYCFFFINCADIAKDPIIRKIIKFEQIPKPPRGFELHEFNSTISAWLIIMILFPHT